MASVSSTGYRQYIDEQLVTALSTGDRNAFAEVYERYWNPLYRVAYQKVRSREVAEELVQNLFVSLWVKREQHTIRELRPYLFTALRFSIINHIESEQVHERFIAYYESFLQQTEARPVDDELALRDLTEAIERSLHTLPEQTQQVFRLSRFDCLTIPEIAARLNLSEKTIQYHLAKALRVVRENLHGLGTLLAVTFAEYL
ncbi:RNA polymerase sigma-70 factor [Spirosoma rhododendri]|uniref:RNA polymerase sigma-70 factor n=1 Tax=Spirosoma rhododendri TaxID=2728024 RepID=A0A7L5DTT0_9BACT|nr:RNA polymerase sigma-70 factor [Spirosoma rhododendri]QJD80703.1 RNA polymerase sigma-70 factor [Spirosoma rhododendri]